MTAPAAIRRRNRRLIEFAKDLATLLAIGAALGMLVALAQLLGFGEFIVGL